MKKVLILVIFFTVLLFSVFASTKGTSDKTIIKMLVGSKTAYVDGVLKTLDAAPNIVAGRTLVPIRFVSEGLGANVNWDGSTKAITITMDSISYLNNQISVLENENNSLKSKISQLEKSNQSLDEQNQLLQKKVNELEEELKKYKESSSSEQVVEMHITYEGFKPSTLTIKNGIPVKWIIYGDQVSSCTNKIIVPSLNISKSIVAGENIINFTPKTTGTIDFSCWMGMVKGKFMVN
jgi:regulator of replication initiation timing